MLQIRWHGHSCFEITNDVTLVTDPHDGKSIGISPPDVTGDIILVSHDHYDHNSIESVVKEKSIVVKDETAKTVSGVQIKGIRSFHDEHEGRKRGSNLIYLFNMDGAHPINPTDRTNITFFIANNPKSFSAKKTFFR